MAISMIAAVNSTTATIAMRTAAFLISLLPRPCKPRRMSQTLSARPVEYEINSSQVNGNRKSVKNIRRGDIPGVEEDMVSAAITTPVL